MKYIRFGEDEVLASVTEKDEAILTSLIVDYLKGDQFAMYAIDVDEGFAHISFRRGFAAPYSPHLIVPDAGPGWAGRHLDIAFRR